MQDYQKAIPAIRTICISDDETNGRPVFPTEDRDRLQTAIELVLLNPMAWEAHRELLLENLRSYRHCWLVTEVELQQIVEQGLVVLDDARLAQLALNELALLDLSRAIEEELSLVDRRSESYWAAAEEQHGARLLLEDDQNKPDRPNLGATNNDSKTTGMRRLFNVEVSTLSEDKNRNTRSRILVWNEAPSGGTAMALGSDDASSPECVTGELMFPVINDSRISEHPIRLSLLASFHFVQHELRLTVSLHYGDTPAPQSGQRVSLRAKGRGAKHELAISYGGEFEPLNVDIPAMDYTIVLRIPRDDDFLERAYDVCFGEIAKYLSNS